MRIWYTAKLEEVEVGAMQVGDPLLSLMGQQLPAGESKHEFDCKRMTWTFQVRSPLPGSSTWL